jgi:hypothetical protein
MCASPKDGVDSVCNVHPAQLHVRLAQSSVELLDLRGQPNSTADHDEFSNG